MSLRVVDRKIRPSGSTFGTRGLPFFVACDAWSTHHGHRDRDSVCERFFLKLSDLCITATVSCNPDT